MANLTEEQIKQITQEVIQRLGDQATSENVRQVVNQVVQNIPSSATPTSPVKVTQPPRQNRIIITAFGKNRKGILAGLTGVLAENQCDILDLSQKILQEFFTIMLLVDISDSPASFEQIKERVIRKGEELDLKVIIQHEDIFNTMHRI